MLAVWAYRHRREGLSRYREALRRAGLLPPLLPAVEEEQEAIAILRSLPADVRAVVLLMMRGLKE